jgi:signal transduction histidine kinase
VFRIAQEALSNALRHSGAAHIAVRLSEPNGRLLLTVEDDGVGFEPESAALRSRRLGLTSMEERADALGGRLSVESRPGAGARIGLEVPLGGDSRADRG